MGRIGWIGFSPRSFLLRFKRSCGNSPITGSRSDLIRGRTEDALPFLRSFSHLSLLYGCNLDIVERPHNTYTSRASSLNRSFHATALRYAIDRDYYEVLGVPKDATWDDIKKAFHALAKKYHPDANKNNPAAKRKFQEIRDAYETLRDPEKRAQYDKEFSEGAEKVRYAADDASGFRSTYQDPFSSFYRAKQDPFSDTFYKIFSEVFENERDIYAADIQVELNLSFPEAAKGCTKKVSFSAQVPCDSCYGRGHSVNTKPIKCPTCNGVGRVTVFPFTSTCRSCKGLGKIIKDYCLVCKGSGVVDGVKNVNVTIPAGVDSGDTIHVPRAGNQGGRGAQPGNLYINLQVAKDPVFSRDGADIYVDAHIRFPQAILGGKIEVPTLFGKTQVKIPKGVQPGQLLVLRGRGLPKQVGLVDHGDQYVRFRVNFPSSVNERQRELLEEFAKEEAIQESSGSAEGNRYNSPVAILAEMWKVKCRHFLVIRLTSFKLSSYNQDATKLPGGKMDDQLYSLKKVAANNRSSDWSQVHAWHRLPAVASFASEQKCELSADI